MKLHRPAKQDAHNGFRPSSDPMGRHSGEDYGWASGDGVYAAAEGVVEYVYDGDGRNRGWGKRVILTHSSRADTTYNHLDVGSIRVEQGQRLERGARIGTMGSTGKAPNGRHLHFELYVDGVRVNPHPYFARHLPGTAGTAAIAAGTASHQQRVVRRTTNRRADPTLRARTKRPKLRKGTVGNFDGFIRGEEVTQNGVTSRVWFRGAYSGDWFWSGNFTSQSTAGLKDLGTFAS
jgi:hypothetical protein